MSEAYDPRGIRFYDAVTSREMKLVNDPGDQYDGWLLWRHPDGQWVTLRKATPSDKAKLMEAADAAAHKAAPPPSPAAPEAPHPDDIAAGMAANGSADGDVPVVGFGWGIGGVEEPFPVETGAPLAIRLADVAQRMTRALKALDWHAGDRQWRDTITPYLRELTAPRAPPSGATPEPPAGPLGGRDDRAWLDRLGASIATKDGWTDGSARLLSLARRGLDPALSGAMPGVFRDARRAWSALALELPEQVHDDAGRVILAAIYEGERLSAALPSPDEQADNLTANAGIAPPLPAGIPEHNCLDCRHRGGDAHAYPCRCCYGFDRWEADPTPNRSTEEVMPSDPDRGRTARREPVTPAVPEQSAGTAAAPPPEPGAPENPHGCDEHPNAGSYPMWICNRCGREAAYGPPSPTSPSPDPGDPEGLSEEGLVELEQAASKLEGWIARIVRRLAAEARRLRARGSGTGGREDVEDVLQRFVTRIGGGKPWIEWDGARWLVRWTRVYPGGVESDHRFAEGYSLRDAISRANEWEDRADKAEPPAREGQGAGTCGCPVPGLRQSLACVRERNGGGRAPGEVCECACHAGTGKDGGR